MTSFARHVLAIDLGTSGPKVALVSERGEVAAHAVRRVETTMIPPAGAEQDPEEIWAAIRGAVREVVAAGRVPAEAIAAVACTSQYSSIVPVDADGNATSNLLLWMDGRGGPQAVALRERHPEAFARWIEVHGFPPLSSGTDSLSKMLWLRQERPEAWRRTHCVLEPMDWMLMRLTGRFTANVGTAFTMLLTDGRRLDSLAWATELLQLAGIPPQKLPELVPQCSVIGTVRSPVAGDLGLRPDTKVVSGTNDTQAAALATATFRPGAGAINVGTTGQVLAHLDERKADLENALVSMPSPLPGRYMVMAENGIAARVLDHFLHSVVFAGDAMAKHTVPDPFAGVERAVRETPAGAGGLIFLPWLTGTGSPDGNANARGAFVNISVDTDRARMLRAIFEGVAFSLRRIFPAVERLAGGAFPALRFSGGGARSDAWAQILADVLDRPVLPLSDPVHSNNRASALLAFATLGIAGVDDVDRFCPVRGRFEPQRQDRALYDERFARFCATYEALCPVFDALNAGNEGVERERKEP
jgi:xylulokinase